MSFSISCNLDLKFMNKKGTNPTLSSTESIHIIFLNLARISMPIWGLGCPGLSWLKKQTMESCSMNNIYIKNQGIVCSFALDVEHQHSQEWRKLPIWFLSSPGGKLLWSTQVWIFHCLFVSCVQMWMGLLLFERSKKGFKILNTIW